ncbi:hypothetical protein HYU23_03350 [Candidatus Woesearchaeota archaeon]|nr:hypothetical protein [Candidatus Woesearchaeota archaeon]
MPEIITAAIFGLLGGTIRALVGLLKQKRVSKTKRFKISYLIITIILSGLIGAITSTSLTTNNIMNLVIGYAGIDLLENLLKIITKKTSYF